MAETQSAKARSRLILISEEFEWLVAQSRSVGHGEVAMKLIVHNGEVVRVERSVVTKLIPAARAVSRPEDAVLDGRNLSFKLG